MKPSIIKSTSEKETYATYKQVEGLEEYGIPSGKYDVTVFLAKEKSE